MKIINIKKNYNKFKKKKNQFYKKKMNNYNIYSPKGNINLRNDFINYVFQNGRYKPTFYPASNLNPDKITGKIGQEYKGSRTPQSYYIRRYYGIPQPIDTYYIEHRNNFNDFYSLGNDYNPFDNNQNQLRTPFIKRNYNYNNYNNYYYQNKIPVGELKYNYSKDNYKEIQSISKSSDNLNYDEYKRMINQKEKQLIGNYDNDYQNKKNLNIQIDNYNQNLNQSENHFSQIKNKPSLNIQTESNFSNNVNSRNNTKFESNDYYTEYQRYPNEIKYDSPCKIFFI